MEYVIIFILSSIITTFILYFYDRHKIEKTIQNLQLILWFNHEKLKKSTNFNYVHMRRKFALDYEKFRLVVSSNDLDLYYDTVICQRREIIDFVENVVFKLENIDNSKLLLKTSKQKLEEIKSKLNS